MPAHPSSLRSPFQQFSIRNSNNPIAQKKLTFHGNLRLLFFLHLVRVGPICGSYFYTENILLTHCGSYFLYRENISPAPRPILPAAPSSLPLPVMTLVFKSPDIFVFSSLSITLITISDMTFFWIPSLMARFSWNHQQWCNQEFLVGMVK